MLNTGREGERERGRSGEGREGEKEERKKGGSKEGREGGREDIWSRNAIPPEMSVTQINPFIL